MLFEEEEEEEDETLEDTLFAVREVSIYKIMWRTSSVNGFSPIRSGPTDSVSYREMNKTRSGSRIQTPVIYSRLFSWILQEGELRRAVFGFV
ncbi:hypothetical protein F2Q70_00036935 [Brassica cretica]|uniref:Uncharacterized protein n=1 Tax=Brassica cretica TaxID=69181 RepID=A0A8S9JSR4_BRACR|nr:hypothetical protein F2Q70_00036935 [Brassica cretica]